MAGEAAQKPAGSAVFLCSAQLDQAEGTGSVLTEPGAWHARLDRLVRRRRWPTTTAWTLLLAWDMTQCDVYLVLKRAKPTKRAADITSMWQRVVRGLVASAGADVFALVRAEWAPASKEQSDAAPGASPYAQAVQDLLSMLQGKEAICSSEAVPPQLAVHAKPLGC